MFHDMRPGIGNYCWDKTVFKGNEKPEKSEEISNARIEIEEEMTQKLTDGFDQMHVEDVADDEEVEYIDLIPVPDSKDSTGKPKIQSKITSFSLIRKNKLESTIFVVKKNCKFLDI